MSWFCKVESFSSFREVSTAAFFGEEGREGAVRVEQKRLCFVCFIGVFVCSDRVQGRVSVFLDGGTNKRPTRTALLALYRSPFWKRAGLLAALGVFIVNYCERS